MPDLMWRGYFSEGRILFPKENMESEKLKECSDEDQLEELVDEIYTDYDSEAPVWSTTGYCVVDGKEVRVEDQSKDWVEKDFFELYKSKIKAYDCCAVFVDHYKGYSQIIEIDKLDPALLRYENGLIYYDQEELIPDDYRGSGSEKVLFKKGERIELE